MEDSVLLDVKINAKDALDSYSKLQARISELRNEQKKLADAHKENTAEYRANEQAIKALSKRSQEYSKEIQNNIKVEHEQTGSMQQLKAELSLLTAQFNSLSKAQREADLEMAKKGNQEALASRIKAITTELNQNEQAILNYRRNVGNYENAVANALGANSKWMSNLQQLSELFKGGVTQGLTNATSAVGKFGKQLLSLLANPIVATIALIGGAFMALSSAIKSDEEASNALERVLAPLKGMFDGIVFVLQKTAEGILYVVEGFENLAMSLSKMAEKIPVIGGAFESMNTAMENRLEAVKANQEAERMSREMIVETAETENKVAKLRDKVAQKNKYTAEERRKFLEQAIALEKKEAENQQRLAKMRLKALQLEAKNTENNAEMKRKLAEATAEVVKADTNFYNVTLRLQKQLSSFDSEIKADTKARAERAKKSAEDAKKNAQERASKEREAIRKEEDSTIALIVNQYDQRRATINAQYNRQIEDLRLRLKEEKNLTEKAREAINKTIINLEQKREAELIKIGKDETESLQKTLASLEALVVSAEAKKVQSIINTYAKVSEDAQKQIDALQEKMNKGTISPEEEEALFQLMQYQVGLEKAKQKELDDVARESNLKRIKELETAITNEGAIAVLDYSKTEKEKNDILIKASEERIALYKKELEATTDSQTRLELEKRLATEEQSIRQNTLKSIQYEMTQELADASLTASEKYRIKQEYLEKELEAVRGNADAERDVELQMIENRKTYLNELASSIEDWGNKTNQLMSGINQIMANNEQKELNRYKAEQNQKKDALKSRLDQGLISEEAYNSQVQMMDEETAQKEHEIAIAQAKREKAMNIMSAIMNTATAIMRIWADVPKFDFGASTIALTAMASALGAVQVATIASQPLPVAGDGMLIKGKSHKDGGVYINAEGGEAIINKKATKKFLPLLSRINQSTGGVPLYGSGGVVGISNMQSAIESGIDYDALAEACANIPIYTAVTDINRGQRRVAQIEERKTY